MSQQSSSGGLLALSNSSTRCHKRLHDVVRRGTLQQIQRELEQDAIIIAVEAEENEQRSLTLQSGCRSNTDEDDDENRGNLADSGDLLFAQTSQSILPLTMKIAVNRQNKAGWTPLAYAVEANRSLDIIEYLLEMGAALHYCNVSKRHVLHHAAVNGNVEMMRVLLERRIAVEEEEEETGPGSSRKVDVTNSIHGHLLLDQDECGATPLYCAVDGGHVEVVRFLLGYRTTTTMLDGSYPASSSNPTTTLSSPNVLLTCIRCCDRGEESVRCMMFLLEFMLLSHRGGAGVKWESSDGGRGGRQEPPAISSSSQTHAAIDPFHCIDRSCGQQAAVGSMNSNNNDDGVVAPSQQRRIYYQQLDEDNPLYFYSSRWCDEQHPPERRIDGSETLEEFSVSLLSIGVGSILCENPLRESTSENPLRESTSENPLGESTSENPLRESTAIHHWDHPLGGDSTGRIQWGSLTAEVHVGGSVG